MSFWERLLGVCLLAWAQACLSCGSLGAAGAEPAYVPDPEIEKLAEQAAHSDNLAAQNALARLAALGGAAEDALRWHISGAAGAAAKARWAGVLARLCHGAVVYRVTLELEPDGSGLLTLWSNRSLLRQCADRYARLLGNPKQDLDGALKNNIYSKGALFDFLNDGVKHLEAVMPQRGDEVEAQGLLSFKNFDALAGFAEKFDLGSYYMLAGATLSDSVPGVRTYRFKKARETSREHLERNLLLFHDVQWQFVLDFKGQITSSNAPKTDGARLVWTFNCWQMVNGEAQVEASFGAAGLPPRLPKEDRALALPDVVQAGQPIAVVRRSLIRAKVYRKTEDPTPPWKVLLERGQLVELDGRDSLPHGAALQYRWKQTSGLDLESLTPADLSQPNFGMVIKEPGEYGFELVVSSGGVYSKPAEVKVIVQDDGATAAAKPAAPQPEHTPAAPPPAPLAPPKTVDEKKLPGNTPAQTPPDARAKAQELCTAGEKALKAFQYAEARKALSAAAELDPDNANCRFNLAVALLECGEVSAALVKFEDLAVNDQTGRATMYVGHCHLRTGNKREAGRWYRKGAEIGKEQVRWEQHWQLGALDLADKDYESALRRLADAVKDAAAANVKDPRLLYDYARALHGCKKDEEALRRLETLQELGYTPDPQFVAEVLRGAAAARAAPKTAEPQPKSAEQPKTTEVAEHPAPKVKPASPETKPAAPEAKPAAPEAKPATPEAKPATPEAKPAAPETKPAAPEAKPAAPEAKPVAPEAKPVAPEAKPVASGAKLPDTPNPPQPAPVASPRIADKKAEAEAGKEPPDSSVPADIVDLSKPRPANKSEPPPPNPDVSRVQPEKKIERAPQPETKKTPPPTVNSSKTTKALPAADSAKTVEPPPPAKVAPPKPPPPAKPPLPPVPEDFDKALAAGKLACAEAKRLFDLKAPEAKTQAVRACDVAEAMLQGAWAKRPGDKDVLQAFKELSAHVKVIAIASNPVIKARSRGLVVLDAGQSLVPEGKNLYCVWEQVGGEKLPLRPEDLSQKKVGVRIARPGIYKFELAVSDGSLGGNPVTVTVEIEE